MTSTVKTFDTADVRCACGHAFSYRFCYLDDWQCPCPKCGTTVKHPSPPASEKQVQEARDDLRRWADQSADPTMKDYVNREFQGEKAVSLVEGFHPKEVGIARRHISAGKIHDDGTVSFRNRSDQRKFVEQKETLRMRLTLHPHAR